jgi:o-succinylbenzoate synthase
VASPSSGRPAAPHLAAPHLAALTWTPYALRFRLPFQTALERLTVRRGFLVRAVDSQGRAGHGEAAPIAGFGMEPLAECGRALEAWARRLSGRSLAPQPPGRLPDALAHLALLTDAPAARHGMECALADLAAQAQGAPLHRWLLHALGAGSAGAVPAGIAVNATLGALDPDAAAGRAAELAAQGYGTVKVKVGFGGAQADGARVRAVRDAAPGMLVRVDANGAWTEAEALAWLRAHASLGLEYAEQPVPRGDVAALARLTAASPVPVAADESVLDSADAEALLAAQAAHILVLKPMALGGLLAALRVAQHALGRGVPVVLTSVLEGAFGRAAALHAAAAAQALSPRALPAMGLATGALLAEDLVAHPPDPVRGRLTVPQGPGLGLGQSPIT